jgi:hypothetical protein
MGGKGGDSRALLAQPSCSRNVQSEKIIVDLG